MKLNSLLIAAGLSSRMGNFKPLLIYKNEPVIISIIKKLLSLSSNVFVVTGFKEKEIIKVFADHFSDSELRDKIVLVPNHNFEKGMFTSLQKGLSKAGECDWLLYHFVDQPQIPQNFYNDFITQIDDKCDWIQPSFNERKGHPILIRKSLFKNIINAEENSSLKDVINTTNINKKIWNCSYKEILIDIDTPEDYNLIAE
ncbi:MAG: NTP transferase domain-containing protein [Ignavibacteriaceae bacterium]